jgi:hypothetical protein
LGWKAQSSLEEALASAWKWEKKIRSWLTIVDFWFLIFDLQEYTKHVIARRNDEVIL